MCVKHIDGESIGSSVCVGEVNLFMHRKFASFKPKSGPKITLYVSVIHFNPMTLSVETRVYLFEVAGGASGRISGHSHTHTPVITHTHSQRGIMKSSTTRPICVLKHKS